MLSEGLRPYPAQRRSAASPCSRKAYLTAARKGMLIAWWEHSANVASAPADAALGSHTLVIADHNGAFTANRQTEVRYTQSGSALNSRCTPS